MKYLFDENWSPKIVRAVRIVFDRRESTDIISHRENGWAGLRDTEWLPLISPDEDWTIISNDNRLLARAAEKALWLKTGARLILFDGSWGNMTLHDKAWGTIRWWPDIIAAAAIHPKSTAMKVPFQYTPNGITVVV